MALSTLYKVEALIGQKDKSAETIRDLLSRCEAVISKHQLKDDSGIMDALKSKHRSLNNYEASGDETPMQGQGSDSTAKPSREPPVKYLTQHKIGYSPQVRPSSPQFVIKKGKADISIRSRASSNIRGSRPQFTESVILQRATTPNKQSQRMNNEGPRLTHPTKPQVNKKTNDLHRDIGVGLSSMINDGKFPKVSHIVTSEMKVTAKEARREFKDGLDKLLELGEFVRSEIKDLQNEVSSEDANNRRLADRFLDDSSSESRNRIDQAITDKIEKLLLSQKEWEQQRAIMQEKLDRLEKNIAERQTADETASNNMIGVTPKNAVGNCSVENDQNFTSPPANQKRINSIIITPASNPSRSNNNNFLKVEQSQAKIRRPSLYAPTTVSASSITSRVFDASLEGYRSALKYALHHMEKMREDSDELRMVIEGSNDELFEIGFIVEKAQGTNGPQATIRLYPFNREREEEPSIANAIVEDSISLDQLKYILNQIHAIEVFPPHIPAASFTHIGYFLIYIFSKFVQVSFDDNKPTLVIQKNPRSLITSEISTKFFGSDYSVTLIHTNEMAFRLILRRISLAHDDNEGICADVIFNNFVMTQLFETRYGSSSSKLMLKVLNGEKISKQEINRLRSTSFIGHNCSWLGTGPEKKVFI